MQTAFCTADFSLDGRPATYANLGRNDEAFQWFERAYSEYDSWMFSLQYADIDTIRDDPRFEALLAKLNLPIDAYR